MAAKNVAERLTGLTMDSGAGAEELKARLDVQAEKAADAEPDDPKKKREYSFPFEYQAPGGKAFKGTFKNRILNARDRMLAGTLASDLVRGRPFESLPGLARELAVAVSWMTYSLDPKSRPEWAQDLSLIDDEHLILALYGEVWDHQSTFLGRAHDAQPQAPADA